MRRLILLLGLVVILVAAGVAWRWNTRVDELPWSDDMGTVADANNRFALDLYAQLREQTKGNLFFSPYSAHAALAMAATGARGTTRDQMAGVLHLPADEQKAAAAGDLGRYYDRPRDGCELTVANAIWGQKGFPWRAEFLDVQKARFGAAFREADFAADPDGERQRINGWVGEKTRGRIPELIGQGLLTPLDRMVLTNAVYFKGEWRDKFNPVQTRPSPFRHADGSETSVPLMHREGGFRWYVEGGEDDRFHPDFQVGELPYKGGLSMVVLLPGKFDGLPALEAKMTADALNGWLSRLRDAGDTELYLPKFRLETDALMLTEPLQKLGMTAAFDPSAADFTGMQSSKEQLIMGLVVQKAFVDVNEEGTEAAAATAATVQTQSARPIFRADHPFLFLIRDVEHGTILFMGRVEKP
jgi:serpin B